MVSLIVYAGILALYFLSITVLRRGRKRDQEYSEPLSPRPLLRRRQADSRLEEPL
jgi:hypothetical protein